MANVKNRKMDALATTKSYVMSKLNWMLQLLLKHREEVRRERCEFSIRMWGCFGSVYDVMLSRPLEDT